MNILLEHTKAINAMLLSFTHKAASKGESEKCSREGRVNQRVLTLSQSKLASLLSHHSAPHIGHLFSIWCSPDSSRDSCTSARFSSCSVLPGAQKGKVTQRCRERTICHTAYTSFSLVVNGSVRVGLSNHTCTGCEGSINGHLQPCLYMTRFKLSDLTN